MQYRASQFWKSSQLLSLQHVLLEKLFNTTFLKQPINFANILFEAKRVNIYSGMLLALKNVSKTLNYIWLMKISFLLKNSIGLRLNGKMKARLLHRVRILIFVFVKLLFAIQYSP